MQSKPHSPHSTHARLMSSGGSSIIPGDLWMLTGFPCLAKRLHGQCASKRAIAQFPAVPWCTWMLSSTQLRYIKCHWFWSKIWRIRTARGKNFGDVFFDIFHQAEQESEIRLTKNWLVAEISDVPLGAVWYYIMSRKIIAVYPRL